MKAAIELDNRFESVNMAPSFCRKRPRSQDDELDESIPISKRINSLNIEGRSDCSPESAPSPDAAIVENGHSDMSYKLWHQQQQQLHSVYAAAGGGVETGSKCYPEQSTSSMSLPSQRHPQAPEQHSNPGRLVHPPHNASTTSTNQTVLKKYSPELDESSNPYYYHINEILYKAHIARLERSTKPPPPPLPLHNQQHHHHHHQQQQFPFNR